MILSRTFHWIMLIMACFFVTGCNKPIGDMDKLDGCYFAAGSYPVFQINKGVLSSPQVKAHVAITSSSSDATVISFDPGIRITENIHKSMIVAKGPDVSGLAFESGKARYILLSGNGIPIKLEQRLCD